MKRHINTICLCKQMLAHVHTCTGAYTQGSCRRWWIVAGVAVVIEFHFSGSAVSWRAKLERVCSLHCQPQRWSLWFSDALIATLLCGPVRACVGPLLFLHGTVTYAFKNVCDSDYVNMWLKIWLSAFVFCIFEFVGEYLYLLNLMHWWICMCVSVCISAHLCLWQMEQRLQLSIRFFPLVKITPCSLAHACSFTESFQHIVLEGESMFLFNVLMALALLSSVPKQILLNAQRVGQ